jgi:hypothetical protein
MLEINVYNFYFSNSIPATQQNLTALHKSVHVLNFNIATALEKLNKNEQGGIWNDICALLGYYAAYGGNYAVYAGKELPPYVM